MKRKFLSLVLAATMACANAVPAAAAAPSADQRLSAVTAKVKAVLALDTAAYPQFHGDLEESPLSSAWSLEWSGGEAPDLSVRATEAGKILEYRISSYGTEPYNGSRFPSFPAGSREEARKAALAFLDRVLDPNESAVLEDEEREQLNAVTYSFHGQILVNGLPAGQSCYLTVYCRDNTVRSFSRDDLGRSVMGGVPSNKPAVLSDAAGKTLRETLALRLEYVLAENEKNRAVLRYLPEPGDEYYVDAASGKLVNLTELARAAQEDGGTGGAFMNRAMKSEASADMAVEAPAASPAEIAGAEQLQGVLSREELDQKARSVTALGLTPYTLSSAVYTVPRKDGEEQVTATLRYGRQVNGVSWRRTVSLDARTGALLGVSSSGWMPEEKVSRNVDVSAAQKKAEAFLKSQCGAQFAETALYHSADALENEGKIFHGFTFCQKANGYFCPESSLNVQVDATDGSIAAYGNNFVDGVAFDSPEGILTRSQALDAWLATYDVTLAYIQVPAAVDYSKPEYAPLRDMGVSYLYKLVLGYGLERETYYTGLDAKTGKPVESFQRDEIRYTDLEGCWAKEQIETLARYQVGYSGGKFQPEKTLTQLDLVALLASTQGYRYDETSEDAADNLYRYAYSCGILSREARKDGAVLSRLDAIRMILDTAGYGGTAKLRGIYRTDFSDAAAIPAADLGYAALAQGLGTVSGDEQGRLLPTQAANRAQAAVMVYNLMGR